MPAQQFFAVDICPWASGVAAKHGNRIPKIQHIMRPVFAKRDNGRKARAPAACPSGTLLVILTHGWDISESNRHQRSDVDSDLHCCCAA